MSSPHTHYSDRVDRYLRGRPGYPDAVLDALPGGRPPADAVIADIAAGTGLLAEVALRNGNRVLAVEPDAAMRAAARARFAGRPGFRCTAGTAEATGLPDACADLITVGQALHWFDLPAARAEFGRILRPGGRVLLAWNEQVPGRSPLQSGIDALLRAELPGYGAAADGTPSVTELAAAFFGRPVPGRVLPNRQALDAAGLLGRVLSNSYAPAPGDPAHDRLRTALLDLHAECAVDGLVHIDYDTWVFQDALERTRA
ncbi:class I SAM-dependent methyltransferase [Kitasatospora phosalacinea]|uniref:class I SAM-dependent methyltransferase n=1 Tax=Kitasatospora phosalacinea TaxID=2065 RepID=UPI00052408F5|nr:class I SAM-dependent methyltransferase [Kitasatospora phosalacinea]